MSASKATTRLLIADHDEVARIGLRILLGRASDLEVVGEARTMAGAVEAVVRLQPEVVLLDIRLPNGGGFEACRRIRDLCPATRVLVFTGLAESNAVMRALAVGAAGYLLKDVDAVGLIGAVRSVAAGQSVLDPAVTGQVIGWLDHPPNPGADDKFGSLSAQEQRVLALVAEGKTNKAIATAMGLSDKTIKNYFSNILGKLNLARRSQAAAYFVRHSNQSHK